MKELSGLADGPNGCGKLVMGGCSFAWNFCVIRSTVLAGHREDTRPNTALMQH